MSEGKYGRLPQPKDRSKRKVDVTVGEVSLTPEHDKAGEWEEEGDEYHAHAKPQAKESMLAKLGRLTSDLGATSGGAWTRFMRDDDKEKP